jgi:hypothetical protein
VNCTENKNSKRYKTRGVLSGPLLDADRLVNGSPRGKAISVDSFEIVFFFAFVSNFGMRAKAR